MPSQQTLWHDQPDATDSEKDSDPCAQSLLLTGTPGCPTESATGSRQCNSLQYSLVHGSGRLDPNPLTKQDKRARGTRRQDSQDKQRENKRIQGKSTSKCDGREEVTGGCVCDVGAGGPLQFMSHLSKLAASTVQNQHQIGKSRPATPAH